MTITSTESSGMMGTTDEANNVPTSVDMENRTGAHEEGGSDDPPARLMITKMVRQNVSKIVDGDVLVDPVWPSYAFCGVSHFIVSTMLPDALYQSHNTTRHCLFPPTLQHDNIVTLCIVLVGARKLQELRWSEGDWALPQMFLFGGRSERVRQVQRD